MLRDARELLAPAVAEAIADLKLGPKDLAMAKLAERYAAAIDEAEAPDVLDKLGPKLFATLESLGASPAARARAKEGRPGGGKPGGLAALRQAHGA